MLYIEEKVIKEYSLGIKQYIEYMVEAEQPGITICQYIQSLQGTIHNDNHNRNTADPSQDSMMIHEEAVYQNYLPLPSFDSDDDQPSNIVLDDEMLQLCYR